NVSGSVTEALEYLEVNTGGNANATATIAVNANLKEYLGKGSGKDILTVSGTSATVEKINTGAGDDKLDISGTSGAIVNIANATINLGAGDDTLKVRYANISGANIDLGAGNDTIDIASILNPNYLKGTTIDGGAGRDTMLVIGNTVPFDPNAVGLTLKNIEVLQAKGQDAKASKLSVSAVNGQELTLTKNSPSNGTLEIVATNKETNIDLSKLNTKVVGNEVALDKLTLSDVGSGTTTGVTVKLTAKDANIKETIKLAADAGGYNKVTITGIASGDILDLSGITALSGKTVSGAGASSAFDVVPNKSSAALVAQKAYYFDSALTTDGDLMNSALVATALATATKGGTTSGDKSIIAVNNSDKTKSAIYLFTSNNNSDILDTELTLLAVVDNAINGSDKMTAGTGGSGGDITFA
ncbi:hypothetical protein PTQ33_08265, partial [Campylobacter sp. 50012-21]|uniref:hypothetical protein n=1 Tax=Campylobacter magnus TaxID=3026462 RepID=UPI002361050B